MAAQFTATKASSARGERSWSARAASSLPVPDSPWTSTVADEGAAWRTRSMAARNAGDSPTIPLTPARSLSRARSARFSRTRAWRSRAWRTVLTMAMRLSGLVTKS